MKVMKSNNKTTHWKSELLPISEDRPTSDFGGVYRQIIETDIKKKPAKVNTKSAATAVAAPPRPPCHGKGYTSCWSGATVSPAATAVIGGRQTTEENRLMNVMKSNGKTTNWKPELQTVPEDRPTSDFAGFYLQITVADIKKKPVKVKTKSAVAPPMPPSHGKGSRKSCPKFTLPPFPPSSLMLLHA